ncbi:rubrerythrin-like domain-containing protein [Halobaculum limi]|uniref:rubrerythrin-like domain-containing protein n=1 Tax=Halobaculum limi TaxID=3031916 RepID=UPI002AA29D00|nr:rubrerythrin-like domain-containing protein [Halobaculum sp. YSMS11]
MADVRYGNHQQIMTTIPNSGSEATLYVCRDCGDGIEDPTDTNTCPRCGGPLVNSTVPHD